MMISLIKVMLNASLGVFLLAGLTGCQSTGIADSNQKVDSQLPIIPIPQNNIQYNQLKNIIESHAEKNP